MCFKHINKRLFVYYILCVRFIIVFNVYKIYSTNKNNEIYSISPTHNQKKMKLNKCCQRTKHECYETSEIAYCCPKSRQFFINNIIVINVIKIFFIYKV